MRRIAIGLFVMAAWAAAWLALFAIPNYSECRSKGFSRWYCASTHLIR